MNGAARAEIGNLPMETRRGRNLPAWSIRTLCVAALAGVISGAPARAAEPGEGPSAATNKLHAVNTAFEEFAREWEAQAGGTNAWAAKVREQPGWTNLLRAAGPELRRQAEQGNPLAQLKVAYASFAGDGSEPDFGAGIKWLTQKQTQAYAPGQFLLGMAFLRGLGTNEDFAAGVQCLNQAAAEGFAGAEYQLGLCYLEGGAGVNQAPERGLHWLELAAEQGLARAEQALGDCYALGLATDRDPAQAAKWYRRAADKGVAAAQDCLAICLMAGAEGKREPTEAVQWLRKAAEQGLAVAQCHLARCYAAGEGVAADASEAARWWRAAADQGYPGADFHLGRCYLSGTGCQQDPAKAVDCFQADAERGHIGAELYLGLCYAEGQGVAKDPSLSRKWWREAALQGISPNRYLPGDGSLGDAVEIVAWWKEVAGRGSPILQSALGEMFRFGHGVEQDEAEALRWYRLAAEAGDPPALKDAAWLLATSDDPKIRDGKAAVAYALRADRESKHKSPLILDTLAAAYAEAGQFDKAVATEKDALAAARRDADREEFQARLKLYQSHLPFRAGRAPAPGL